MCRESRGQEPPRATVSFVTHRSPTFHYSTASRLAFKIHRGEGHGFSFASHVASCLRRLPRSPPNIVCQQRILDNHPTAGACEASKSIVKLASAPLRCSTACSRRDSGAKVNRSNLITVSQCSNTSCCYLFLPVRRHGYDVIPDSAYALASPPFGGHRLPEPCLLRNHLLNFHLHRSRIIDLTSLVSL